MGWSAQIDSVLVSKGPLIVTASNVAGFSPETNVKVVVKYTEMALNIYCMWMSVNLVECSALANLKIFMTGLVDCHNKCKQQNSITHHNVN